LHEIKQRTEHLKVALKADGRPYVMPERIVQKVALEPITEPQIYVPPEEELERRRYNKY
jgi:hypothetical protein